MRETTFKKNIITAYLISVPLGLGTILLFSIIPAAISGEGLASMFLIFTYGWAIIGLTISFLIAIYFGSKKAHQCLVNNKSLLSASYEFSVTINTIIWGTFIILCILQNLRSHFILYIMPPLIAYIVCTLLTTFSIGLLMAYLFRRNIGD